MPRLEDVGVPSEVVEKLIGCQLHVTTVERLWVHDETQLSEQTKIPIKTLEELRAKCGLRLCPPPTVHESCRIQPPTDSSSIKGLHPSFFTAEEELHHHRRGSFTISSGCRSLDGILEGGGFQTRQMTEIVGPSCSGKTQLCLSLAVRVAAKQGDVLYIDANGSACPRRIRQIAEKIARKENSDQVPDILRRIRVLRLFTETELMDALDTLAQKMLAADREYQELRMIVVDPIKSFISPVLQNREGKRNGHFIVSVVGRTLNYLALRYGLAVLAVNGTLAERTGVEGKADDGRFLAKGPPEAMRPSGKPALGPSWALYPSLRLLLGVASEEEGVYHATIGSAASQASGGRAFFCINAAGVVDFQGPQ